MKNLNRLFMGALAVAFLVLFTMMAAMAWGAVEFKVRIENISSPDGQTASNGSKWLFALSPGLWVVHGKNARLFASGKKDSGMGLEAQAEDGNPGVLAKSLEGKKGVMSVGIFNVPVGGKRA